MLVYVKHFEYQNTILSSYNYDHQSTVGCHFRRLLSFIETDHAFSKVHF